MKSLSNNELKLIAGGTIQLLSWWALVDKSSPDKNIIECQAERFLDFLNPADSKVNKNFQPSQERVDYIKAGLKSERLNSKFASSDPAIAARVCFYSDEFDHLK